MHLSIISLLLSSRRILGFFAALLVTTLGLTQPLAVTISSPTIEVFDYLEITIRPHKPDTRINPFKDVRVSAVFQADSGSPVAIEGFCDSQDGSVFKVRFMPSQPGSYRFEIQFSRLGKTHFATGSFQAVASQRRGPIQLDPMHPGHFQYQNGDRYYWNSTTTYWLMGWRDEQVIHDAIDRLAEYDINRIRVAINGRAHGGSRWSEPTVIESPGFTFKLNPWVAEQPDDLDAPGFDITRFEVGHWQKLDRLLAYCRDKNIVVSLIFYVDGLDHATDPFKKEYMGQEDEQRYYAYAAARYSAFENVMWDIANEYHLFRTPEWAEQMGTYLRSKDPYKHLISVHGNADFPFRRSPWVDIVMHQSWDECGGFEFMMKARAIQAETGRVLPIINEEYGYEEHYPPWGCGATAAKERPGGRSAWNRSKLAWEIGMAGGYQTTGERADRGTGAGNDSGGGWINGRGDSTMTMLKYYAHMRHIFEQVTYWEMTPRPDLVNYGNLCLAKVGKEYLIYARTGSCRLELPPDSGHFAVWKINPQTGETASLAPCLASENGAWQYPQGLESDCVFILRRSD